MRNFAAILTVVAVVLAMASPVWADMDFKVQRGEINVTGTGSSILAGTDYEAPADLSNAFIRIVNTRLSGGGKASGGGNQNAADWQVSILNPADLLTSIDFARYSNTNNTRVSWEIIEYIGAPGGANEFIVRDQARIVNGGLTATGAIIGGIVDDADVVPFITGQSVNADNVNNTHRNLHISDWDDVNDQPLFTRNASSALEASISYAAVEFTGSNWDVQRAMFDYGTLANTNGTSEITPVDVSSTFIHAQNTATQQGLDDTGVVTWLSAPDTISHKTQVDTNQKAVTWVIQNLDTVAESKMEVQRFTGSKATGGAEPGIWNKGIDAVDSLTNASIMGETARSAGTGTSAPRGSVNLTLTAVDNVRLWQSDTGQPINYAFEVVQWPSTAAIVPELAWDEAGAGNWADGIGVDSRWIGGGLGDVPDLATKASIATDIVTVQGDQAALALDVLSGGVLVDPAATLTVDGAADFAAGASLTINGTLAAGSLAAPGTVTFGGGASVILGDDGGAIGTALTNGNTIIDTAGPVAVGTYSDQTIAGTLTKRGVGTLSLDNSTPGTITAANTALRIEAGTLEAYGIDAAALGGATQVTLAGGELKLGLAPGAVSGSPVAHWKFDEGAGLVAGDSSGNGRGGTLTNFIGDESQWVAGKDGGALLLDGIDNFVNIAGYKGVTGTDPRTLSAWIKNGGKDNAAIMSWGTDSAGQKLGSSG